MPRTYCLPKHWTTKMVHRPRAELCSRNAIARHAEVTDHRRRQRWPHQQPMRHLVRPPRRNAAADDADDEGAIVEWVAVVVVEPMRQRVLRAAVTVIRRRERPLPNRWRHVCRCPQTETEPLRLYRRKRAERASRDSWPLLRQPSNDVPYRCRSCI